MKFIAKHNFFNDISEFTDENAPNWITSANAVRGSTMDSSWFWREHILTLEVGQSAGTDFHIITRVG